MKFMTISHSIGALALFGLAALGVSSAQAAGPAAVTAIAASAHPAIAAPPSHIGGQPMFGTFGGMPVPVPNTASGGHGGGEIATNPNWQARFGNALYGTPLGNLQIQTGGNPTYGPSGVNNGGNGSYGAFYNGSLNGPTIGGVNGAGTVLGGYSSGGYQSFQNGAFEVGGRSRGIGVGGNYPMPTVYGTALPNYSAVVPGMNNAIYGTNMPTLNLPSNGYNPGNYNTTGYGFTPSPQVITPSALPPNPTMAPPVPVEYGFQ